MDVEKLASALTQLEALGLPVIPLLIGAMFSALVILYVKREKGEERSGPARCGWSLESENARHSEILVVMRRVEAQHAEALAILHRLEVLVNRIDAETPTTPTRRR